MYVYSSMCIRVFVHEYVQMGYTLSYIYTHANIHMYIVRMQKCIQIRVYIHLYVYTLYKCTYILVSQMYMHMCTICRYVIVRITEDDSIDYYCTIPTSRRHHQSRGRGADPCFTLGVCFSSEFCIFLVWLYRFQNICIGGIGPNYPGVCNSHTPWRLDFHS